MSDEKKWRTADYLPVEEALEAVLDCARALLLDLLARRREVRCLLTALPKRRGEQSTEAKTSKITARIQKQGGNWKKGEQIVSPGGRSCHSQDRRSGRQQRGLQAPRGVSWPSPLAAVSPPAVAAPASPRSEVSRPSELADDELGEGEGGKLGHGGRRLDRPHLGKGCVGIGFLRLLVDSESQQIWQQEQEGEDIWRPRAGGAPNSPRNFEIFPFE